MIPHYKSGLIPSTCCRMLKLKWKVIATACFEPQKQICKNSGGLISQDRDSKYQFRIFCGKATACCSESARAFKNVIFQYYVLNLNKQ